MQLKIREEKKEKITKKDGSPIKDVWDENAYLWDINEVHCDKVLDLQMDNIRLRQILRENGLEEKI